MPTLLHLSVSPRGSYSISRRLSDAAVEAWKQRNPGGRVIERDLAKTQLTFVDLDWIQGAFSPPEQHNENHKKAIALSDELVAELVAADEIILGAPMYNFAIPAALKAWIDHVVRAGKTFRYTAVGKPEGFCTKMAYSTTPIRASSAVATKSIALRARSKLLTLTFDISQSRSPKKRAMAGGSNGYRDPGGRRQSTPELE
jgi:FMN-dependent NADH-azoreductase